MGGGFFPRQVAAALRAKKPPERPIPTHSRAAEGGASRNSLYAKLPGAKPYECTVPM